MNYRDFLQKVIYHVINPLISALIKLHITPNIITFVGLLLNLLATALFIYAAVYAPQQLNLIGWGGAVILFAGLFDMIDGRLARVGGMQSTFGALWDSTLDRYSELFTLFGIAIYLLLNGYVWSGVVTFAAMVGSVMVSYVRARAEGLAIECKVGFMQRPERVVVTSVGALLCGCCADGVSFDPLWLLIVPMYLIAILANITAFWRIAHCYRVLNERDHQKA
ncbi:CDP-diacylglycerol--glycerol-3-phosphate 3-phosphatidyltransferase [Prevotella aff. ruminicola Tc2-24]|jgi:CDP-diacylglycerol--glycerol-3-phosphate 3-phosphatidyltransferase|uniref:CDP-diacylglycerol--glycerol-3-phosphate 3-phosphatidyltransferase n=1 Tax=Prevotella aff. ruminicola Tc2-24 TaxID=81582 RepID=A0A1I0PK83_9BACT|nr:MULTISPECIES: CDP-alcohol phosphatidyltransferase family protein [Prevotella]SEE43984.1 CDP-diacylglycerol--glycerol-3-phosphate 3-phosphatidyltransferase [Prevotella sp. lc2012]SEW14837.1 CDP-diacylglycerol--glycerol-3-phosphate 3-phosphatidyltransferase [Prevotella aff. ruminicola Tc2-24]